MIHNFASRLNLYVILMTALFYFQGCFPSTPSLTDSSLSSSAPTAASSSCPTISGSAWVPNIPGAGAYNHLSNLVVNKSTITVNGPLTGLGDPATSDREISISIDMTDDLGPQGSLALEATVENLPATISGGAFPALVSLSDGTNDYINLPRSGASGDCAAKGYYLCSGAGCSTNKTCAPAWPSAFITRNQWEQHQVPIFGYRSYNVFPSCNGFGGSAPPSSEPACAFNSTFFPKEYSTPRLRFGTTYTAKYVLLTSDYTTYKGKADLKVNIIKKKNPSSTVGGAIDINMVLVGTKNIQASRTPKGQQNLNALFTWVSKHYSQSSTNVKIGQINVLEWSCELGGDYYSKPSINDLGTLFQAGSKLVPSSTEGKALNVFFVSQITGGSAGFSILGLSGGIGGVYSNGDEGSGLAFSSFDKLEVYNKSCNYKGCDTTLQESSFIDMGATISHEMGHYFGLNHPSESSGGTHDPLFDTPVCSTAQSLSSSSYITQKSCSGSDPNIYSVTGKTCPSACPGYDATGGVFCQSAIECQFNHVMWWSAKKYKEGTTDGDGNIFSSESGSVINYSPFVR